MLRSLFDRLNRRPIVPGKAPCGFDSSRLLAYLDHELNADARRGVESHLEQCAACRAEIAAHGRAETALTGAATMLPSPGDLRPEFYARLEQSQRRATPIAWSTAIPAVACAGLILVFGRSLLRRPQVHGQTGQPPGVALRSNARPTQTDRALPSARPAVSKPDSEIAGVADAGRRTSTVASNKRSWGEPGPIVRRPIHRGLVARVTEASDRLHVGRLRIPRSASSRIVATLTSRPDRNALVDRVAAQPSDFAVRDQRRDRPTTYGLSASAADKPSDTTTDGLAEPLAMAKSPHAGIVLASFGEAELHVSDESRDFMSSTHIDATPTPRSRRETVRVEDDNDTTAEPVELPAIP